MDLSKLTTNQRIAVVGAMLAAVSLFLPWHTTGTEAVSAFDSGLLAWGGLLVSIAGVTILALKALDIADVQIQSLRAEQIAFVLASLGTVMIVMRRVIGGEVRWGFYVGLLATAVVLYGTFSAMRDAGSDIPSWRDPQSRHNR